jgi:hypothetical protein
VEAIVQEAKRNRVVSIEQLASAKDSLDREAYAVATKSKRRCLNRHLLLLGRSVTRPSTFMLGLPLIWPYLQVPSPSPCAPESDRKGHPCIG